MNSHWLLDEYGAIDRTYVQIKLDDVRGSIEATVAANPEASSVASSESSVAGKRII